VIECLLIVLIVGIIVDRSFFGYLTEHTLVVCNGCVRDGNNYNANWIASDPLTDRLTVFATDHGSAIQARLGNLFLWHRPRAHTLVERASPA